MAVKLIFTNLVDEDAETEEALNEFNLLTAEGEDTNMSSNKIEDSDWTKSMGELRFID